MVNPSSQNQSTTPERERMWCRRRVCICRRQRSFACRATSAFLGTGPQLALSVYEGWLCEAGLTCKRCERACMRELVLFSYVLQCLPLAPP